MRAVPLESRTASDFLLEKTFAENAVFFIPRRPVLCRSDVLVAIARGKRVLHVGCVDHLAILDRKMADGTWLHGKLAAAAARCVGVDINGDGIVRLRRAGYKDVIHGDVSSPELIRLIASEKWDYAIFGEVLEHVDNPVGFLARFREAYANSVEEAVITVPNAFTIGNVLSSIRGCERINTDHRWWFSPYTLAKICSLAGFEPHNIELARFSEGGGLKNWARTLLTGRFPMFAQDLIMYARLKPAAGGSEAPPRSARARNGHPLVRV